MEERKNEPYDNDGSSRGNCTVGVGHLLNTGPCNAANNRVYSDAEIDQFLDADLSKAESIVINTVRVSLNQYEFDALVMLAFNYPRFGSGGAPRLVQALNAGRGSEVGSRGNEGWGRVYWIREAKIRKEWADINKSNGKIVRGLTSRRSREIRLFFDAVYSQ
jgi:GH24 family phage-related lysozyme (muramidase)